MNTVPSSASPHLSSRTLTLAAAAAFLAAGLTGCKSNSNPAPIITNNAAADPNGPDPAAANMAGAPGQTTQVMGQSQSYSPQQQGESYAAGQQAPAPVVQGYNNNAAGNEAYLGAQNSGGQAGYDQGYTGGEAAEAATAPPPLPVYDQPPAPDPNDIWTPGYWNYAPTGYYWVPGTWVAAPYYGALWTPPYWGYYGSRYRFHHGYWGPHIGYYGGINYGFGYIGIGYYGGYWRGHDFFYNRSVNRLGPGVRTVYERPVVVNNIRYNIEPTVRVSYNGGPGGINAQPRPFEVAAERERHEGPLPAQLALREAAATNRGNFFAQNQGRPAQVAFAHPPSAPAALPANNPGQPFNRPGAPANTNAFNRPGAPAAANQPFNRPGNPGNNGPGFHENGANGPHPAAGPVNHPAPVANPGFNRPAEPANRPGGFNNPNGNRPAPAAPPAVNRAVPEQPHVNQPGGNPGFNRPVPQGNRGIDHPAGNPGFNRPAPAAAPHGDAPRPSAAPAPHVEAPRSAPAPHVEAPHPAPAPRVEAPHGPPAEAGGHPPAGVHPGPR